MASPKVELICPPESLVNQNVKFQVRFSKPDGSLQDDVYFNFRISSKDDSQDNPVHIPFDLKRHAVNGTDEVEHKFREDGDYIISITINSTSGVSPQTDFSFIIGETDDDRHKIAFKVGGFLVLGIILSIWGLIETVSAVPITEIVDSKPVVTGVRYTVFGVPFPTDRELLRVIVATFAGAHGGLLHGLAALADNSQRGKPGISKRYLLWYAERPFLGAGLGLAIYFVFRSGILALTANESSLANLDIYTIAAVGVITGIAEARAIDKLREIFRIIFGAKRRPTQMPVKENEVKEYLAKGYRCLSPLPGGEWLMEKLEPEEED